MHTNPSNPHDRGLPSHSPGSQMGAGIGAGLVIGPVLGAAFDNIALGLLLGSAFGAAVGAVMEARPHDEPAETWPDGRSRWTLGLSLLALAALGAVLLAFLILSD
jgi:hypothetical protein